MESRKVQTILGQMQKSLECSICLEMMSNPVSTNCGHQFCRFCLMEFLERKRQVPCPLCKKTITKRSLTERGQLGNIVTSIRQLITAFQLDTGEMFSPPRGSQANIIPSTPEPSQSTQASRAGADISYRGQIRDVPAGKSGSRKVARGKKTEYTEMSDSGTSADELLKCIAEGIHGAVDTEDNLIDLSEVNGDEDSDTAGNVVDIGAGNQVPVSEALLELIENGSHGAIQSNSYSLNSTDTPVSDMNGDCVIGLEGNKDSNKYADTNIDETVLSGVSDTKCKDLDASGKSGSGQYPLFRTPLDTKKNKNKKCDSTDTVPVRPKRTCRKKDNSCDKDVDESKDELIELLGDEDSEFEEPNFLNEQKLQHTYDRKTKPHAKDTVSSEKVTEWLKNIPTSEKDDIVDLTKHSEKKGVLNRKGRRKADKVLKEESAMGKRMKHLANQSNKDLLFNVDDFANSPKAASVSSIEEMEVDVKVVEPSYHSDSVDRTDKEDIVVIENTVDEDEPLISGTGIEGVVQVADKENVRSDCDLTLTEEAQPESKSDNYEFAKPVNKKRIFKARAENKNQINNDTQSTSVKSTCEEVKAKQPIKLCKQANTNMSKDTNRDTLDPYDFVSSPTTTVKFKKGKKKVRDRKNQGKYKGSITVGKAASNTAQKPIKDKVMSASQVEIDKVSSSLNQAETYDLLTCTQEAAKEFDNEEKRSEANRKRVSFREPLISDFIHKGKIDVIGYRAAKSVQEKETGDKHKGTARKNVENDKIGSKDAKGCNDMKVTAEAEPENTVADTADERTEVPVIQEEVPGVEKHGESDDESEDWRFHDNSSGTGDLDIDPGEAEFEKFDLEIQPEEVKERLSSQAIFEKNILMKSQDTGPLLKSPDPSIIAETPLIFTAPKFKKKVSPDIRKGGKKKGSKYQRQAEADNVGNQTVVPETPNQAVIPETPLLTFGSLEDTAEDTDKGGMKTDDSDKVIPDVANKNLESSEETQAPSLEIVEDVEELCIIEDSEMMCAQSKEMETGITNLVEPSLALSIDLSDTQNSESILLPSRKNKRTKRRQHSIDDADQASDNVKDTGAELDLKNKRTTRAQHSIDDGDQASDKMKETAADHSKDVQDKKQRGKKRKKSNKAAATKSMKDNEKHTAEMSDATKIDSSDTETEVRSTRSRADGMSKVTDQSSASDGLHSKTAVDVGEEVNMLEDDTLRDLSQVTVISVDSTTQRSVQLFTENPGKRSKANSNGTQESSKQSTGEAHSVSMVPDSVVDEEVSQVPEFACKTDSLKQASSQNESTNNVKKRGKSSSSKRLSGKQRRLSQRNSSEESFRQRNHSGLLVSPQTSNSFSPENIFAIDSEMPVVESSPHDLTLQPCYLSDDGEVAACSTLNQQQDAAIVTVCSNTGNDDSDNLDGNSTTVQNTEIKNSVRTPSQESKILEEKDALATPSSGSKRASRTARGFSKRQRLSDIGSSDSELCSVKSPFPNLSITPKSSTTQQYKSPLAKYTSPKLTVAHNLPLVGKSGQPKCDTPSSYHSKVLSTPKRSPASSHKYSASVNKHMAVDGASLKAALEAEIIDVNMEKETGCDRGTQKQLPDFVVSKSFEITSSTESVSESMPKKRVTRKARKSLGQLDECDRKLKGSDNRANDGSASKNEDEDNIEKDNADSEIIQDTANKIHTNAEDNEEVFMVNDTRSSSDLNLNSCEEDNEENLENDDGKDENISSPEFNNDGKDENISSPEFNLDCSDDEEDMQKHALEEISKFDEIKEHTEHIVKDTKSNSLNKIGKTKIDNDLKKNDSAVDSGDVYSTRLDSSPVQPELPDVIQESDVDSDDAAAAEAESDEDSDDEVVRRKNVKKAVIESSSDDEDESSRHMNLTSSSAFSSQSENLSTQDRLALEHDLERMEREMRAMKEQLRHNKKSVSPAREPESLPPITVDDESDDAMIEADDTGDEHENAELYLSPPLVSPARSQEVTVRGDHPDTQEDKGEDFNVTEKGDNAVEEKPSESQMETLPPSSLSEIPESSLPSQRPPLKDLDLNVAMTTPPVEKKILSFIASGLSGQQIQEVKKLAAVNDIKFYNRFNTSITHVIVKPDPAEDQLCDRTLKFFQGVANKCWIVSHFWVVDSRQVGYLLPEGAYEIQGDTANGAAHQGPRRSRLSKDKLFNDMEFVLIGDNAYLSKDSLQELIEACGGRVLDVETVTPSPDSCYVISCTDMEEEENSSQEHIMAESKNLYHLHRLLTFTREWVLDSITMYKLQPLQEYLITKVKKANLPFFKHV